jgi:hypothetical protein
LSEKDQNMAPRGKKVFLATWSRLTVLAQASKMGVTSCQPGIRCCSARGLLMLFYKIGLNPGSRCGMIMMSRDEGLLWTMPRRPSDGILGTIKTSRSKELTGQSDMLCPVNFGSVVPILLQ